MDHFNIILHENFQKCSETLKVKTGKECCGVSLHTRKKRPLTLFLAFINVRLQRCRLAVYFVKSLRGESVRGKSVFAIFYTFTVKCGSLDISDVDTVR